MRELTVREAESVDGGLEGSDAAAIGGRVGAAIAALLQQTTQMPVRSAS